MSRNIISYTHNWKDVKGNHSKEYGQCPRCHNNDNYKLVYDASEYGFVGVLSFKYNKQYAFKCPICPNFDYISNELAKSIIKGSKC